MLDLAQAHATYRFVIVDEENEEQRIMVSPPSARRLLPAMAISPFCPHFVPPLVSHIRPAISTSAHADCEIIHTFSAVEHDIFRVQDRVGDAPLGI
jgi:hypothetical protein